MPATGRVPITIANAGKNWKTYQRDDVQHIFSASWECTPSSMEFLSLGGGGSWIIQTGQAIS